MNQRLQTALKGYLLAAKALRDAMERTSGTIIPQNPFARFIGFKQFMAKYNDLAKGTAQLVPITVPIDVWDMKKLKDTYATIGLQQQEYFDATYTNLVLLISFLEHTIGLKADEILALRDFFGTNLRRAVFDPPEREKDVQDVVEQLLIGRGMIRGVDYDREMGRVKVSIKEVIPDFIIPRLSLAIEIKLSKDKTKSKAIVDEINADIQAYGAKYSSIIFIVYDLGSIQNEAAFKQGLERPQNLIHVVVVKH